MIRRFLGNRRGTTAVEYGLIAGLIFLVIVTSVTAFGNKTTGVMNDVATAIDEAIK